MESFNEEEIRRAVWDCGCEKSPGPDELNFKFIKQFWQPLKSDFLRFLDEFHANGIFPKGSNASFISLVPKVPEPQSLNDFRPISLIGYVYKIVSKLLSNRLKKVLPTLIDERQSAFIEGRQMLQSVVTVNEVIEEANRGWCSKLILKGLMILFRGTTYYICCSEWASAVSGSNGSKVVSNLLQFRFW